MFLNCICILYKEAACIPDANIGVFRRDYITSRHQHLYFLSVKIIIFMTFQELSFYPDVDKP